ncbi:hypothetical protein N9E37_04015 [Luminiphilus sp.]|nr:hypothetical protein [Luminiphilus sp.]
MSNYTKTTNFATKDALASGNPAKIVKGTEIDTEFNNIAVASGTKADKASPVFTGTVTLPATNADSLSIGGDGVTVTGIKDEDDMASNSATKLASQQSIKAYVDSQVTAQDLDVTDGTTSISIDLDSEALSLLGGTGVTSTASGNGVTMAIDGTVATLSGSQTLTNKTLAAPAVTGALTTDGTIDGRDVAVDGTKLDTVETNADVTDTTNVTAAGALMDSEVTNLAQVKAFDSTDYATAAQGTTADAALPKAGGAMTGAITTNSTFDGRDVATDGTKLDGIEALADVTDATNVTAAGALMDSELTSIASVKALDQGVATTDSPSFAAATVTGEITANGGIALGDNDKATFGASDDLQIFHDGTQSLISEVGTGNLSINGTSINFNNNDLGGRYAEFVSNGAVNLFHAGDKKLATTATGIDVTGTATMDGLTVDGAVEVNTTSITGIAIDSTNNGSQISFESAVTSVPWNVGVSGDATEDFVVYQSGSGSGAIKLYTDGDTRLNIANNGDISFYEDTGTTPKLFWDASAESLGIGTSSPQKIHGGASLDGETSTGFEFIAGNNTVSTVGGEFIGGYAFRNNDSSGTPDHYSGIRAVASNAFGSANLEFYAGRDSYEAGTAPNMIILGNTTSTDGNVGIGTSSPTEKLHLNGTALMFGARMSSNNGSTYWDVKRDISTGHFHIADDSLGNVLTIRQDSGNVGIGTSSPATLLDIKEGTAATDAIIGLTAGTGGRAQIRSEAQADNTSSELSFHTMGGSSTSEAMRIDSSGRVGIGTSSPDTLLEIVGADPILTIRDTETTGAATNATLRLAESGASDTLNNYWDINHTGNSELRFVSKIGLTTAERMRIDSSGNLLVGKTATSASTAGAELQKGTGGQSALIATAAGTKVGIINRLTNDGDLLEFRKDGTTVGSIGAQGGDVYISSSAADHGGLRLANGSILPLKNGALNAGEIDLGQASGNLGFKDLYLSGGVYLGGTGAANKLDDYETGTFTPVMENVTGWSGSSGVDGTYTKIGNTVHVFISMASNVALTGTPTYKITGLPFSSNLPERTSNVSISRMFGIGLTTTDYIAGVAGTEVHFSYVNGDNNVNNLTHSGSTLRFTLSATYQTAA